jgi:hypothetical protein
MCTVSVIAAPDLRLACNRDELLTRPDALPPRVVRAGERLAILPIDPASGGTWIAVNDAGVAFTLLNVNAPRRTSLTPSRISRGLVIPSILHCPTARAARAELTPGGHQPFRLVVTDARNILDCTWDGDSLRTGLREVTSRPVMMTSSGLGDDLVREPRTGLFESLLNEGNCTASRQDAFHRHRWDDAPHLSVCMSRRDARTVSYTTVQVTPSHVTLSYLPGGPATHAGASHWCLNRVNVA